MKKTYLSALIGLILFSSCSKNYPEVEPPLIDNSTISFITKKTIGDSINLKIIFENEADRLEAWIDLNNNGIKEEGEAIEEAKNYAKYKIESQTIKIYGKVSLFHCTNIEITKLDVSRAERLQRLECFDNAIQVLDFSNNKELENLECEGNQLKSLDISQNTKLKRLKCSENQLISLDVSKNKALELLYCNSNQLKAIDLSKNVELEDFICFDNLLKDLDLSQNTKIKSLDACFNHLERLNISGNKELKNVQIYMNKISDATEIQAIVDALPEREIEEGAKFTVLVNSPSEENQINIEQIAIAQNKNWKVAKEKISALETNRKLTRAQKRRLQN